MAMQQVNGKWYDEDMSPEDIMQAERINANRQGYTHGEKTRGEQFNEDWIDPWSKIDDDDSWLERIGKTAADWTIASPMKLGTAIGDQIEDWTGNKDGKEKEWRVNPLDFSEGGGEDFWNALFSIPAFKAGKVALGGIPNLMKAYKTGGKPALDRYMKEVAGGFGMNAPTSSAITSGRQIKNKLGLYPGDIGWKARTMGAAYPASMVGVGMAGGPMDNPFDDGKKPENATVVDAGQTPPGQIPSGLDPNIGRSQSWKTAREFLEGGMADHPNFDPSQFPNDPAHGIDKVALRHAVQGDVDGYQIARYHDKLRDLENRGRVVDSHQDLIDDWKASKENEDVWSEQDKMKWVRAYNMGELDDFKLKRTPFTDAGPPSLDNPSSTPKPGPGITPKPPSDESGDESLGFGGSASPWAEIGLTGGALALWLASRGRARPPRVPGPPAQLGLPNRIGNFTMPGGSTPMSNARPYTPPRQSAPQGELPHFEKIGPPYPGQPTLGNKPPRLDNARPNFETVGGPRNVTPDVINVPPRPVPPRLENTRSSFRREPPHLPYARRDNSPGVQDWIPPNWREWTKPKRGRAPDLDDFGTGWWDDALRRG